MSLDEFRKVIGVKDEDDEKYAKNSHLKLRILDRAQKEINNFTDLYISYTLIKDSRSYKYISFMIKEKTPLEGALAHHKQRERLNR